MSRNVTLSVLPSLEPRRSELELCGYCPKLCRAACPVSEVEARETTTPWGKMSVGWLAARGMVPFDEAHAATAWACTGCRACAQRCDHHNPVADTLLDIRAEAFERGVAPEPAQRIAAEFAEYERATERAVQPLYAEPGTRADASTALLVGCTYVHRHPKETRDAITAASALAGGAVRILDACCGKPLLQAGDRQGFRRVANRMASRLARVERLIVVDPGCALTLRKHYPAEGISLVSRSSDPLEVELMVEVAARVLDAFTPLSSPPDHQVRYHDPCHLGRGLGSYGPPRSILTRMLGRRPDEFPSCRESGGCSGAGGLLPLTHPETSDGIADRRIRDHEDEGGGEIVTACASSLAKFRARGAKVSDLVSWIARGLRAPRNP